MPTNNFSKTDKQKEAISLISGDAVHNMLFGGGRSGKTFILLYAMIVRACKVKSRHVIFRSKFNHIKVSIFMETLPRVMSLCFPNLTFEISKTDYYITLPNGSEIWFCGLDSGDRVEKILGKEYSTIWFNECSQIDYSSVSKALTRLAEKNSLKKKVYYDENPPAKSHWTYWQFIKKLNPANNEPLANPENYQSFLMNPVDNIQNIDENYLAVLDELPEKDRNRFKDGIFNESDDGVAYYSFSRERHVVESTERYSGTLFIGMDFNVNPMTAVICQVIEDKLIIHDEIYLDGNSDTFKMCNELKKKGYYGTVIPDSTGKNRKTSGKSDFFILEESGFTIDWTRNPFVKDRVNNVNRLLVNDRLIINKKCKKLINDLEKVSWKNDELDEGPEKLLTHISDALGYAAWKLYPYEKRISRFNQGRQG